MSSFQSPDLITFESPNAPMSTQFTLNNGHGRVNSESFGDNPFDQLFQYTSPENEQLLIPTGVQCNGLGSQLHTGLIIADSPLPADLLNGGDVMQNGCGSPSMLNSPPPFSRDHGIQYASVLAPKLPPMAMPATHKAPIRSNSSLVHSSSLDSDLPSSIHSMSAASLNDAFMDSSQFSKQLQMAPVFRHRLHSLPRQRIPLLPKEDSFLGDSILLEASHLALKLRQHSILDQSFIEGDELDLTGEPAEIKHCLDDLLLADDCNPLSEILTNDEATSPASVESPQQIPSSPPPSLTCKNVHEEQEAHLILKDLSSILTTGQSSAADQLRGQHLLHDLAELLERNGSSTKSTNNTNNFSTISNVSSTSSAGSHRQHNHRQQSGGSVCSKSLEETSTASSLLQNGNSGGSGVGGKPSLKRLSRSFSLQPAMPKRSAALLLKKSGSASSSLDSNSGSVPPPFKSTAVRCNSKTAPNNSGPLRAIAPLEKMVKGKVHTTPKKPVITTSFDFKYQKKTSTPKSGMNMKSPMAQSTPDAAAISLTYDCANDCVDGDVKLKMSTPVSPLARNDRSLRTVTNRMLNRSLSLTSPQSTNGTYTSCIRRSYSNVGRADASDAARNLPTNGVQCVLGPPSSPQSTRHLPVAKSHTLIQRSMSLGKEGARFGLYRSSTPPPPPQQPSSLVDSNNRHADVYRTDVRTLQRRTLSFDRRNDKYLC